MRKYMHSISLFLVLSVASISVLNASEHSAEQSLPTTSIPKLNEYIVEFDSSESIWDVKSILHIQSQKPDRYMLHLVALGIQANCYGEMDGKSFKEFINGMVAENTDNFELMLSFCSNSLSPLTCVLYSTPWSQWGKRQIEQASIVFHAYKEYVPLFPKSFVSRSWSMLHLILYNSRRDFDSADTYPERYPYYLYFKNFFETQDYENIDDEEFLKYAFVFLEKMTCDSPLLDKMHSLPLDISPCVRKLEDFVVEDPYSVLRSFLQTEDSWRLCMDFCKQRSGEHWSYYDRKEPGTIQSLLKAFSYILDTNEDEITPDYLERLYAMAFAHRSSERPGRGCRYGVTPEEMTLSFMLECHEGKYSDLSMLVFGTILQDTPILRVGMYMQDVDDLLPYIQRCITEYYEVIRNDESSFEQKIIAALELSHTLVIMHPHEDGNTRTFTTLLLNKTLMSLGLPPAAFEDPNSFDGKTSREGVPLVLKGIENFKNILEHGLLDAMLSTAESSKR